MRPCSNDTASLTGSGSEEGLGELSSTELTALSSTSMISVYITVGDNWSVHNTVHVIQHLTIKQATNYTASELYITGTSTYIYM